MEENKEKNITKIIIITGASGGIGKALAQELAKENKVIGTYYHSEEEAQKLDKIENIEMKKVNLANPDEIKSFINQIKQEYGKFDVLINNAGISQIKLFTDITDSDWEEMIRINLSSVFYMTRETVKSMIQEKSGCVINISSIWGETGASCEVHYSVAKAGVDGMTKALAKELGPSGIRVNSIAPGIINTKMNQDLNLEEIEKIKEEIPLERIGYPQDIVKCVKWLIEDTYTTGQIIGINGGWYI